MKSPAEAGRLVGANYKNHRKYTKLTEINQ